MSLLSLALSPAVLTPVTSNEDLDTQVDKSYFATNDSFAAFYIGLFFNDLNDTEVPPQHLKYDLRLAGLWFTDLLYPFLQIPGPRDFTSNSVILVGAVFLMLWTYNLVSLLTKSALFTIYNKNHEFSIPLCMYSLSDLVGIYGTCFY